MREPKLAVVGATGAVGNQFVELAATRAFPRGGLRLFASAERSADTVETEEGEFEVEELNDPGDLRGFDLAVLAVPETQAAEIIRARPGPVLIDLSAAMRPPSDEPLVAPGLTPRERLSALRGAAVFAVPHPAAHALATILSALGIKQAWISATLLAGASAGGRNQVAATVEQSADLLSGKLDLKPGEIQCGFNVLIGDPERRVASAIRAQVGALMEGAPEIILQVMSTPILHGSALAIAVSAPEGSSQWPARLKCAPGLLLAEEPSPLGVIDALGREAIIVRMESQAGGASLFCVFDNARVAALIAVWIAENLLLTSQ